MNRLIKDIRGTALLVSLLVMGVLVSVALALSNLIFRELIITKEFLDAGKAYYSAESGVEIALYALESKLPGWEPNDDGIVEYNVYEDLNGKYELKNRCSSFPCFDPDEYDSNAVEGKDLKYFYGVLDKNESIQIPLFIVEADANIIPVGDFTVEFYATFDPDQLKFEANAKLNSWDILRWKIFGFPCVNGNCEEPNFNVTDSISDFTAFSLIESSMDDLFDSEGNKIMNHSAQPAWFGTVKCSDPTLSSQRITDEIQCISYSWNGVGLEYNAGDEIASTYLGFCDNTQAREYYLYETTDQERELDDIKNCYNISDFLDNHYLNYLTLTNLINSAVFEKENSAYEKLYYRVEFFKKGENTSNEVVREVADIIADGFSGNNKQSINAKIQRGSFMPVFNFSLYSTYEK